jgi:hypothetical protein
MLLLPDLAPADIAALQAAEVPDPALALAQLEHQIELKVTTGWAAPVRARQPDPIAGAPGSPAMCVQHIDQMQQANFSRSECREAAKLSTQDVATRATRLIFGLPSVCPLP